MELWIARDKDGDISLYYEKPILDKLEEFWCNAPFGMRLSNNWFPEVTFENSPQKLELKLCNSIEKIDLTSKEHNVKAQPCVLTNHGIVTDVVKFD